MGTSWQRSASRTTSPGPWSSSPRLCAETLAGIADPLFPALAAARVRAPLAAARAVLGGMLEPLESPTTDRRAPEWLLAHQADAVLRARAILARFGGALVADGVGLGKTFIGLALAAMEQAQGGSAAAFVPAALVAEWKDAMRRVGVTMPVSSHTSLARRAAVLPERCTLLVIDEAHAFRNPRTARYDALARLSADRRVALLTATPLNNTPTDLEALIHLFAPRDRFRELGVADLGLSLRRGDPAASLALGAVSVCRTRRLVEDRFPSLRDAFPRRRLLAPVSYDLDACYGGDLAAVLESLDALAPAPGEASPGATLLHIGLLRRLESSRAALRRSLARQRDVLDEIGRAAEQGVTIDRADVRSAWKGEADECQLALWPLLAPAGHAPAWDRVVAARASVNAALARIDAIAGAPDAKAEALERLLAGALAGSRVIVFTEYRDTALYLFRRLRRSRRAMCVVGDSAWAGATALPRDEALDAFAPRARRRRENPLLHADVLIATDVLSEGLNLQDARAVVSYDLPWNPVRVMQRVGRIERLGSPHRDIHVAHLLPGGGFRELTSVLATLRRKLAATSQAIGAEPDPLASLWWLDEGAPGMDSLERESWRRVAPFEARERWRAAMGAGAITRGAPLLAAAVADDEGPSAVGVLLALEWKGGNRVPLPFVIETGSRPRRDPEALGALAVRALTATPVPSEPGYFTAALASVLPEARDCLVALSAARRGTPDPGPGRRAALESLIPAAVAAHWNRADDEVLSSAIDLLARDLRAGNDRLIGRLAREGGSAQELARRILEILKRSPAAREPNLPGTPRLVLVAAIGLATRCLAG